jgi:hypothetical protein
VPPDTPPQPRRTRGRLLDDITLDLIDIDEVHRQAGRHRRRAQVHEDEVTQKMEQVLDGMRDLRAALARRPGPDHAKAA